MFGLENHREAGIIEADNAVIRKPPRPMPELFDYLGAGEKQQTESLAQLVVPDINHRGGNESLRNERADIFRYLRTFLLSSINQPNDGIYTEKGFGLSKRPFMMPTGMTQSWLTGKEPVTGEFRFGEQYRWDSWPYVKLLNLLNARHIARDQIMNLVDVQQRFHRIPNALTTDFLSHPQPPLEAYMILDQLKAGDADDGWVRQAWKAVRNDLLLEWFDSNSGRVNPRQYEPIVKKFQTKLARYVSVHFHSCLVGCQAGTDHTILTAEYGEEFLPVQLNCLLYGECQELSEYYHDIGDERQSQKFKEQAEYIKSEMNRLMWVKDGEWAGFRNFSIVDSKAEKLHGGIRVTGKIRTDDLTAEIFPLFTGLADPEQAYVILDNLKRYQGDIGLATTVHRPGDQLDMGIKKYWNLQWEQNAWPPLMMIVVDGLNRYAEKLHDNKFHEFAVELQINWVKALEHSFRNPPKGNMPCFYEKMPYDSHQILESSYYGNLPGFGWTLSSYAVFLNNLVKEGYGNILH
jgi:neutral trehalase